MVSGRIYSGWYNVNIDQEVVQLIVSYSLTKWKISRDWFNILKSNIYSFSNREDMIRSFKALIEIAQKTSEYKLLSSEITSEEVLNYRTNFVESMEELINEIKQINNSQIISSDIDKTILSEMAKVASNDFIANKTKFPINMFDEIRKEKAGLISSNRVFQKDFEKSYIMSEDRLEIHNMVESCGEMILAHLRDVVLNKVVLTNVTEELCFESLENMLFYILSYVKTPDAVLLCHHSLSTLIFDLCENKQKVEQYKITKIYSEEYFCKIGDCEVYNYSFNIVNSCILTTKDRFKDLILQDFENDNIVNVVFDENEQDKTKGDLSFDYKLDIETDESQPFIKMSVVLANLEIDEEVVEEHIDDIIQEELNEDKALSRLNKVFKFITAYRR